MNLEFTPITRDQAIECAGWQYESPYDLYNILEGDRPIEIEGMLGRSSKTFAVFSKGEFIGVRSFGDDGKVEGGAYDEAYQDTGGALRPDMTAKGLGEGVLRAGLQFGIHRFNFSRFRVTVAAFNQRALKVCRRVGFIERERFSRSSDRREFVILTLEKISGNKGLSPTPCSRG